MNNLFKKMATISLLMTMVVGLSACQKAETPNAPAQKQNKQAKDGSDSTSENSTSDSSTLTEASTNTPANPNMPIIFTENRHYGLKSAEGKVLADAKYDFISDEIDNDRVLMVKDQKWGYLSLDGQEVIAPTYERAFPFADGLAMVMQDGKFGFINLDNQIVVAPEYELGANLKEGIVMGKLSKDEYQLLDRNGKKLGVYQDLYPFHNQRARFRKDGLWGYLDENGQEVIPAIYEDSEAFYQDYTAVTKDNKVGIIDKSGKTLIPFQYEAIYTSSPDENWVSTEEGSGMIKLDGSVVIPTEYEFYEEFGDSTFTPVSKDGDSYAFFRKDGKQITDFIYSYGTTRVSEGVAAVLKDGLWGILDETGKEIVPASMEYDDVFAFSQGLAFVSKDSKGGYINKQGELVIPLVFGHHGESFDENGLAIVSTDRKFGCIDTKGNTVITNQYDRMILLTTGDYTVKQNDLWGVIDDKGHELIPFTYEKEVYFSGGVAPVRKDGYKYEINRFGTILSTTKE